MGEWSTPMVPVSIGELLDKWVILQIKATRITDEVKQQNVLYELDELNDIAGQYMYTPQRKEVGELVQRLTEVNEELWDIEDEIRELDKERIPEAFARFFSEQGALNEDQTEKVSRFFELAQLVYVTNDERCKIKRQLNDILGSGFVEEKSYQGM